MSLPLPAFGGNCIDRADLLRCDEAALRTHREGDGLLLVLDGLEPALDGAGRLRWLPVVEAPPGAELVFLGLREGRAAFAAVPQGSTPGAVRPDWAVLAMMAGEELALYGGARSIVDWHKRHRFCAVCGQTTATAKGGWQRDCGACGASHFPRVDPVAIMLVEHEDWLLLGRSARFPPRRYSALAGFVEPGETLEEAVAREVLEEAGVAVSDVRYLGSQPWPFPSQLMLGCVATALDQRITLDPAELEDARWFSRAEVAEALTAADEGAAFDPPPVQAIARSMLEWWLEAER